MHPFVSGYKIYPDMREYFKAEPVRSWLLEVLDYFEFSDYNPETTQCPYCIWVPDRDYDPIHKCLLTETAEFLGGVDGQTNGD